MLKLCWSSPAAGGELVGRWVEVSAVERPLPEPDESSFGESLLPGRMSHADAALLADARDAWVVVGTSSNGVWVVAK